MTHLWIRLCAGACVMAGALTVTAQTQEQMQEMMKAMESVQKMQQQAAKPVVDFRDIRALLPESLPGMKRTDVHGERTGAMGMTISFASAVYKQDKGRGTVTIKISDLSGTGAMAFAQMGMMGEIDRETDEETERSVTIGGHRGIEKYNTRRRAAELNLFVASRFHVELSGNDVESRDLRDVLNAIDLKKLEALKPKE
jgi:hypothetical protein